MKRLNPGENDVTENQLWCVTITLTDGVYHCDVWATTPGAALQLCLTDARGIETTPLFTGAVREVSIIWKEKACNPSLENA